MRDFVKISAIVLGVALVLLVGITYFLSTKVQYGLIDPAVIPFAITGEIVIVLLVAALIYLNVAPYKDE